MHHATCDRTIAIDVTEYASGKVFSTAVSLFGYSLAPLKPTNLLRSQGVCNALGVCSWVGARTVPSTPGLISNRICCISALGAFAAVITAGYGSFDCFTARRQPLVIQFYGRFADCGLLPVAWTLNLFSPQQLDLTCCVHRFRHSWEHITSLTAFTSGVYQW